MAHVRISLTACVISVGVVVLPHLQFASCLGLAQLPAASASTSTLFRTIGMDDVLFAENVIFDTLMRTTCECAVHCVRVRECLTFTFPTSKDHLSAKRCQGHSGVMTSQSLRTIVGGVKSYTVQQAEDLPTTSQNELVVTGDVPATTEGLPELIVDNPASTEDVPATTEDVPAATEDMPATTKDKPATTEDMPATTKDMLATTEGVPATTMDVPATTEEVPASTEDMPATTESVPATTEDVPATNKDASATTEDMPATTEGVSATTEDVPATTDDVPATTGDITSITKDMSATIEEVPATTEEVPATTEGVPATTKDVPATTEDVPETTGDLPASIEDMPATTEDVPATTDDLPATTDDVSATTEGVPATIEDVPATTEDVPATTGDIASTTEEFLANTEDVPATTGDMPASTEDMPSTTKDVPANTKDMPAATEDVPATTEDVPATTEDVPETTENVPALTEDVPVASESAVTSTRAPVQYQCQVPVLHCADDEALMNDGCSFQPRLSGLYRIDLGDATVDGYCDQETDGGGWLVILRRTDGSENFDRGWTDYKTGFGHPKGEYWLGLEKLYYLTQKNVYRLRVELERAADGVTCYLLLDTFEVQSEDDLYRLDFSTSYSGTCQNFLKLHNTMPFSTRDRDNDNSLADNLAAVQGGGFWHHIDGTANPTGPWGQCCLPNSTFWGYQSGPWAKRLSSVEFKIQTV